MHEKLENPGHEFKSIHVAGTNGKGSVCLNIARNLEKKGFKVGLFTSPHFENVCERISINQTLISKEKLFSIYQNYKCYLENLSFFDLITLICFIYFKENKVDYAVIEVGIGGLNDTTNIIKPKLCVITSISLDHQELLGNTLEEIAAHKAGIIKENTPVVLGPTSLLEVCLLKALEKNAKVIKVSKVDGDYLKENKKIADAALTELGIEPINEIYSMPARFEVHGNIIFDMAHNEGGFCALKTKIQNMYKGKKVIAIWSMSLSKDINTCLAILRSFVSEIYFYPFEKLLSKEKAKELGVEVYSGQTGDIILVCGSIYFLSDAKKMLLNSEQLQLL